MCAQTLVLRQEDMAGGVVAGFWQIKTKGFTFRRQKVVRDLDENACAIA